MHKIVALVGLAMAVGCSSTGGRPPLAAPASGWETTLRRDHPLVGRIWKVSTREYVSRDDMLAELAAARFVLLGEKHDNPDDHRLQAEVLQGLVERGRKPAVVFEQLDRDQQPEVDAFLATHPADAAAFGAALAWEKSGWPPYALYQPIVEVILRAGLPLVAGDLSASDLAALRRQDDSLTAEDRARLGLDEPIPDATRAAMAAELKASHCGIGDTAMFARMIEVQWARDHELAQRLAEAGAEADGAVLVGGFGHARRDRSVPAHLVHLAPGATSAVLALYEVSVAALEPADYAEHGESIPADFVWFTPRVDEDDPCAKMRERMNKP